MGQRVFSCARNCHGKRRARPGGYTEVNCPGTGRLARKPPAGNSGAEIRL
jgi:hypothetical protein